MYENMIICDMDDVLVDFINPAISLHGWSREQLETQRIARGGIWDAREVMGMTNTQWWKPIHKAGVGFWEYLPKMPWFDELVALLDKASNGIWWLSSAPSARIDSYTGKLRWVQRNLPGVLSHTYVNQHKSALAKPGRYLIDDRPDNVHQFNANGGTGILFPHAGNYLREYANDPLPHLSNELQRWRLL